MARKKKVKSQFRSKLEELVEVQLSGTTKSYTYESEKISFIQPQVNRKYTPDFILIKKDGTKMYIEAKGRFLTDDRKKHVMIKNCHPDLDIRFIFQKANLKIRKNSKTTVSMWADKHGYQWAEKVIPQSWLDETS